MSHIITFIAGVSVGAVLGALLLRRAIAADVLSNPTRFTGLERRNASFACKVARGPARPTIGFHPGNGTENWAITGKQIMGEQEVASAAILFFVSRGGDEVPEAVALRFALWWHGLQPDEAPLGDVHNAYKHTATLAPLAERKHEAQ